MSVQVAAELPGPVAAYRRHPALAPYDELVDGEQVRPHHADVADTIASMGLGGLLAARAEARTFVVDEGVVYGSPAKRTSRLWTIDPIPLVIDTAEWTQLASALAQRAHLLDLVLRDLYTDRTLLRRRVLPAAAVLCHPGFARQADRAFPTPGRQLLLTSTDLGRDSSGAWRAISDRTEAPAGAGYAMVTRRIVSRVMAGLHRTSDLARLRGFFHTMTTALMDAAPGTVESPRVVVLSPGPSSETAFDTSFLSTMLGFPVAEADDLLTSHGRVWLRAGDRLEPVDVVLRRVSAVMSDPLEFRGNSEIGVPGLIEAARNGHVTVANPVGAGVLDNPALLAHLEPIARALLGEAPSLSSPQTWWCGDPAGLSHVVANLEHLVIKPVARGHERVSYGRELSRAERDDLVARLHAEPWLWCGQEALELSTAPVVTATGLEPRRFVLRAFGVASGRDYTLFPGGLGRVAGSTGERTVSSRTGLAKDVWVSSSAYPATEEVALRPRLGVAAASRPSQVTPRVAGTLMAIGRHAERAEATARLVKIADDLTEDHSSRPGSPGAAAMSVLNAAAVLLTGVQRRYAELPQDYLRRVALDAGPSGGVADSVTLLINLAQQVRDILSVDTWNVFGRLERMLAATLAEDEQLQPLLDNLLESLLAWSGIMAQSMVRDSSWAFLDAGGRLERAERTTAVLRTTLGSDRTPEVDALVAESVLRACESIITHRRRAAAGTGPSEPVESAFVLLVQDGTNPRSVAHQLAALASDLRLIGDEALAAQADGLRARLGDLPLAAPGPWLDALAADLSGLDARISERHFVRQATRHAAETLRTSWTQES